MSEIAEQRCAECLKLLHQSAGRRISGIEKCPWSTQVKPLKSSHGILAIWTVRAEVAADLLPVNDAPEPLHVLLLAPNTVSRADPRVLVHGNAEKGEEYVAHRRFVSCVVKTRWIERWDVESAKSGRGELARLLRRVLWWLLRRDTGCR